MTGTGGRTLATSAVERLPVEQSSTESTKRWALTGRHRQIGLDVLAIVVAALDVSLETGNDHHFYQWAVSVLAVLALFLRRRFPFVATLLTVPGFLLGWSQLAAMIALGTLAKRQLLGWKTLVGAALIWAGRFIIWPPETFLAQDWRDHVLNAIYGCIVAGMPIAIALLAHAREELSDRIAELAESRERERVLHAHAVRADERARLAREMHDVVSHQVSLIAMQAGALRMAVADAEHKQVAGIIRTLSTRTLDELRQLVTVLRTTNGDDSPHPGMDQLPELVAGAGIEASLTIHGPVLDLPAPISGAVYRTVQEGLTNIRKHAIGSTASVRVLAVDDELTVQVRNTRSNQPCPGLPGGGHGLVGLRERATLLGGTFQAGPTDDNGFEVLVTFPVTRQLDG